MFILSPIKICYQILPTHIIYSFLIKLILDAFSSYFNFLSSMIYSSKYDYFIFQNSFGVWFPSFFSFLMLNIDVPKNGIIFKASRTWGYFYNHKKRIHIFESILKYQEFQSSKTSQKRIFNLIYAEEIQNFLQINTEQ